MPKLKIKPGEPIPSPCVDICTISQKKGVCSGCYRTIKEIANWSAMSDEEKVVVWAQLENRMFN